MTDELTLFTQLEDRGASRAAHHDPLGEGRPAPRGVGTSEPERPAERSSVPRSLVSARAERDQAMASVEEHAGEDWNAYARAWLFDYLTDHAEFFPDDAWQAGLREPPEARAWGPVVKYAASHGWIVKSGEWRQRTRGHATAAPVWRSTLWKGAAA